MSRSRTRPARGALPVEASAYRRTLLAVLAAAALLLAACGDDGGTAAGGTTTSAGTAPIEGTTPVSEPVPAGLEGVAHLTDVRVAAQPEQELDRVVFEFDEGVPGFEATLAPPPFQEPGSGQEVEVAGKAFLVVRMDPARTADLSGEEPVVTYDGPERITAGTDVVTEVVLLGDFEAVMEWVVGLETTRPFRVYTLDGPPRVVVEVAHTDGA